MPQLLTTPAVVLSRRPWSDTSQIVSVITPEHGIKGAVARGAKRAKSGIGPALEPITHSEIVLSVPASGGMAHVRSADVIEFYSGLKSSLVRVALASALCEFVSRVLPEDEANALAYEHLQTALACIDGADDRDAVNYLWWGVLRIVQDVGYALQVDSCTNCGSSDAKLRWFSPADGGPICENCTGENLRAWMSDTREALAWLIAETPEGLASRRIPKRVNHDIRALVEDYLRYHVPNFDHLRALDLLVPLA